MNTTINYVLEKLDKDIECLYMDFKNDNWRKNIPAEPGWYFIRTNTPVKVFKSLDDPIGTNHYKIMLRVNNI